MTADVAREEFTDLEARVRVIDREVEGEKLVTRHILEQTRRNGDDLAAIKSRLDRVEDARAFLSGQGIDVDAIAPQVDGKFMSAFVRATKPAAGCCASGCCS